jgi:site-specific recombinase XerD
MSANDTSPNFGQLLRDFFIKHLTAQLGASSRTIESYRDAFRLFFRYCESELGRRPVQLELSDVDAPIVITFLDWLEKTRRNSVRSRNARLAALKSFLNYTAGRAPACLPSIQRVLALPTKRYDKPLLGYLTREEFEAVVKGPKRGTWIGERDFMLLSTAYNTGARVSELVDLTVDSVDLQRSCVRIVGKGRKLREVPLWEPTARALRAWIRRCDITGTAPLFPTRAGQRMTRSNVEKRLKRIVAVAALRCPSLVGRRISPHTLRHTTAMHLLQSGVDVSVIALWLGHADPTTTHGYIEADLTMKERALQRLPGPKTKAARFRPSDRLIEFLDHL